MYSEYSGGPQGSRGQVVQLVAPRGGTVTDGLRLAVMNGIGLVAASLFIGLIALVVRALDWPVILIGFGVGVVFVAVAVFFWFRYAEAHGRAARAKQRSVRPDIYGAVAALPFAIVGLLLLSWGLFGLLFAMFTFSMSRAGDALQQLLFAVIFFGLAATNVIIARAASD
jgi:hypothetical protein